MDIRALVENMAKQLAPATVRTDYGVLRAILSAAVDADLLPISPCRGVRLPAHARKEIRFLSADELERLADAMPAQYRAMTYLAGVLGLRWSEVAGLRVGRIDFEPQDTGDRGDLRRGQRLGRVRACEDEGPRGAR